MSVNYREFHCKQVSPDLPCYMLRQHWSAVEELQFVDPIYREFEGNGCGNYGLQLVSTYSNMQHCWVAVTPLEIKHGNSLLWSLCKSAWCWSWQ